MGKKIFVSYKYYDDQVYDIKKDGSTIVRDYVSIFENKLKNSYDIYKGEHDNEDLSDLSEDTIWEKLKNKIYDSSVTVIFISPGMKEAGKKEKNQWIPWEISYSLKEISRKNTNNENVTSRTNAMVAVVLPDNNNSYSYYLENKTCCSTGCRMHHTNILFSIIKKNMFNYKLANKKNVFVMM
ncbi:TIR domain-containing protein [Brachyspira pilosicoli]|uniref:TIR domain-containing protein n=1 Tax=Brachyspira pilosicoli TaxID=52584 RepID=UPI001C60F03C|nr:TIR domain-containing protein [Brachyspira pilosicoli]